MTKDQHLVVPLPDCEPEIGSILWMVENTRKRTRDALPNLDTGVVDWVGGFNQHSIGTLLYHIAAIELDWLFVEVLEAEMPSDVEVWFPIDVRDERGRLSVIQGQTLEAHLQRLDYVRGWLLKSYKSLTLAEYRRPRSLENYDVTPEWVLHHLMQHEAGHREEICALRDEALRARG